MIGRERGVVLGLWRIGRMAMQKKRGGWRWWYLLFLVEFAIALWPPFYNKAEPAIMGVPFFYWYQLLAVFIGAVLTAIVYFAVEE
jgi:Protein of unknown function (DUF3311)